MKAQFQAILIVMSLTGAIAGSMPASAQYISAERPESIIEVLTSLGMPGEMEATSSGTPYISSMHDKMPFVIAMMNCNNDGKACKTVQFYFGVNDRKGFSLDHLNTWNGTRRFVRAFRDNEDDPVLVMDIDTDKGGIPDPVFRENIDVWTNQMQNFRGFLLEKE